MFLIFIIRKQINLNLVNSTQLERIRMILPSSDVTMWQVATSYIYIGVESTFSINPEIKTSLSVSRSCLLDIASLPSLRIMLVYWYLNTLVVY